MIDIRNHTKKYIRHKPPLQTTTGKDDPNIVFYEEFLTDMTTLSQERKDT